MIGWSVELSKFDIRYEPKGVIKSQCLADFSAEFTPLLDLSVGWTLYVNDSTNKIVSGARVVLKGPGDLLLERALQFGFKATNNQAEYEALPVRLNLAYDMGAREVNEPLLLSQLSTNKKKSHHRSVMKIWLRQPSVTETECLAVIDAEAET